MTEEFPNASKRAKQDIPPEVDKQIEKVITGEVIVRKPSGWNKFRRSFIAGDATSVGQHVFWNMLLPAAQNAVSDTLIEFVNMMIFGEKRQRFFTQGTPQQGTGSTSKFNYSALSTGKPVVLQPNTQSQEQERFSPNEIYLATRIEAEKVIAGMADTLTTYNVVTVADLYRLIGRTANYTDSGWGWTDIQAADVRYHRGAYLLVLPVPKDLN